jgi:hypothetical protein
VCIIFCILCFPVFAQEESGEPDEPLDFAKSIDDTKYVDFDYSKSVFIIKSFTINVKGYTRPSAIIEKGELEEGEIIAGLSALEKYVSEKQRILFNERVLAEVNIDYTFAEAQEDGKIPVDLTIDIRDTWNIMIVPYPKYSSSSGFSLTLKARDNNFLGTMKPIKLDIGYIYDEEGQSIFLLGLRSDTPFKAFGYTWNFKFEHFFNYRADAEEPYFYKNVTGLSFELPVKSTTLTLGFDEFLIYNEENPDKFKPDYGDFQSGFYMSSSPYISWEIPTGIDIGNYGNLVYTPKISSVFNHEFPEWSLLDINKGPFLILNHILGFNRIDWIRNHRKGVDVSIDNSYNFDFFRLNRDENALTIDLAISGTSHFVINDYFGISSRLLYRQWFLDDFLDKYGNTEALSVVRGIWDKQFSNDLFYADLMLSLNLDFPVKALRFAPSEWFNSRKYRFFDFDMHLSPILDMALYRNPLSETFNRDNILVSGGLEMIFFPDFMRSFYMRFSFAWNLSNFEQGKNYEHSFSIGHHY